MMIKIKVLYEKNYKNGDKFDEAVERWQTKGWIFADMVNDLPENTNAAILYRKL